MDYKLIHGDCLEVLPTLEAGSIDAVITDIPYFRIMSEDWDRQWETIEDYQAWIDSWAYELKRVCTSRASIYIFADDKTAAYVQVILDKHFQLLNNIVWYKTNNQSIKAAPNLRSYAPMTERILYYTPQYCATGWETVKLDVNNFQGLRDYFRDYQNAIGLSLKQINQRLGHRRAEHAFYWNSTQWDLPTEETYKQLSDSFGTNGFLRREYGFLRREYEVLRREYEVLRREYEVLRRTFNASSQTLDIIIGPIVSKKDNTIHPTTKPLWLMKKLVIDSTNEGDTVLDFTMGSGTTGVAAMKTGRNFIGIEQDAEYFKIAETRIKNAAGDFTMTATEQATGQMAIW